MDQNKKTDIRKLLNSLPTTQISDLQEGNLYKVVGKLVMENTMLSLLTKSKCIGYIFEEKKWVSRSPFKNGHINNKWKTISSQTECKDFYIKDNSGKIKVNAYDIKIYLLTNETKKSKNKTSLIENLLLNNDTNYIVLGTVNKNENSNLEISKNLEGGQLIIMDEKFYDIYVKKNVLSRIGCVILLIILTMTFFYFMFNDLV